LAADDERRRRFAENEALYRSVNEQIEAVGREFGPAVDESIAILCECGQLDCAAQIELPVGTYERIRADATLFVVLPGHNNPEIEVVVEEHSGFTIVCKDSPPGREVAQATDPRS
jgi:hypothetical protein